MCGSGGRAGKRAKWDRKRKHKYVLKASCLTLEIKEFRGYEVKIEKVKRPAVAGS